MFCCVSCIFSTLFVLFCFLSSLVSYSGITHVFCEILQCVGGASGNGGEENRVDGGGTVGRTSEGRDNEDDDEDEEIEMETPK